MYATVVCPDQDIPRAQWTPVVFSSALLDSDGLFDAAHPDRLTIPASAPGPVVVRLSAQVYWEYKAGGDRYFRFQGTQNGVPADFGVFDQANPGDSCFQGASTVPWKLWPGDYVQLLVRHTAQVSAGDVEIESTLLGLDTVQ